jgi:molecular chaperone GrpE
VSAHDAKADSTKALKDKLNLKTKEDAATMDSLDENREPEIDCDAPLDPEVRKLQAAEDKAKQHWERLLRLQADMDNAQKRAERDIANAHKYALERFVLELIPVIDGLERAVDAHANDEAGADTLIEGVKMTLKMWLTAFDKFGVQQVNPIGEAFNPEVHQAVSTIVDESVPAGAVAKVLQKGYLLNNRLIQPALVIVAKASG